MQVKITDEPTRTALTSALWQVLYDKFDHYQAGTFTSDIYEHANDVALNRATHDQDAAVNAMVADFAAVHQSIRQTRDAELGATLDLPVQTRQLRSGLESCIFAIEDGGDGAEDFWNLEPEQRRVASDTRDSAVRLRDELTPVDVVA